jgi:hypothetical protein
MKFLQQCENTHRIDTDVVHNDAIFRLLNYAGRQRIRLLIHAAILLIATGDQKQETSRQKYLS